MKRILVLFSLLLFTIQNYSQTIIYEESYNNLPFPLRIDNSGIYSIASFDIENNTIYFSSFNNYKVYEYRNATYSERTITLSQNKDFLFNFETKIPVLKKSNNNSPPDDVYTLKKNFFNGKSILKDAGGNISGSNGEEIKIIVPNRNRLIIESNLENANTEIQINYPSNLACADLIGIDTNGNIFIVTEKYLSEIPLKVEREVIVLSKTGETLSRLELPSIKYLYTLKDLQIDADGNLYHLISFPEKVEIVKWENLTIQNNETLKYPGEFNQEVHFNNFVPTNEIITEVPSEKITLSGTSRTQALKIGETYVLHQYECSSSNLAASGVTAPDGDVVQTPGWLVVGTNARIPYMWGGFSSLAQFDAGLTNGKYAGDINTAEVSSYAVGVDCSGFVSRCWQLSYHSSTSDMPNITTQYSSWDDLKPGDAIHKVGHVRLFVARNLNGSFKVVESAGRDWDVSYWSYTTSDLSAYTPRYYNNIENNYNTQQPTLLSAELKSENSVELKWNCDSTNVLGYRVYSSQNGTLWNIILDENSCKTKSAYINVSGGTDFFRIASVKNDPPNYSESNWSNVLGINNYTSNKKALIVDGFERETGSWQGAGHTFVLKYGKALQELNIGFNSVRTSEIQDSPFHLEDYDYIFWILGDESTVDETFNSTEQTLVANYLNTGGNLFVSGSEIGWDLGYKGNTQDKSFYNNYLKASYISDDAGSGSVIGVANSSMNGCSFNIGQTYEEDYPDEIGPLNGSLLSMKYSNGKGAGIEFSGQFGSSSNKSSLIYLAFPLETTANDESFNIVISKAVSYFNSNISDVKDDLNSVSDFSLSQNYPNPFNPSTTISYHISKREFVSLKIYDLIGNEIAVLLNEEKTPGSYNVQFSINNLQLSSGAYFYRLKAGNYIETKKMILLK
ncbi:MAG: T9SS type A sorting domain-containing protein [Ignavibacteriaceae bacterium]